MNEDFENKVLYKILIIQHNTKKLINYCRMVNSHASHTVKLRVVAPGVVCFSMSPLPFRDITMEIYLFDN